MKNLIVTFILASVLFSSGCGIVAVMGTERESEKKIPAEFDITAHQDKKIAIFVEQPVGLAPDVNLRYYLTHAVNNYLKLKLEVLPEQLISYEDISRYRAKHEGYQLLSPEHIAGVFGADFYLFMGVTDYRLVEIADSGYYKGFLSARAVLLDVNESEMLWPTGDQGKDIKVGFEIEQRGSEAAVKRLAADAAHCTLRYLYDCPKPQFKIADDISGSGWKDWE